MQPTDSHPAHSVLCLCLPLLHPRPQGDKIELKGTGLEDGQHGDPGPHSSAVAIRSAGASQVEVGHQANSEEGGLTPGAHATPAAGEPAAAGAPTPGSHTHGGSPVRGLGKKNSDVLKVGIGAGSLNEVRAESSNRPDHEEG